MEVRNRAGNKVGGADGSRAGIVSLRELSMIAEEYGVANSWPHHKITRGEFAS